MYRAKFAIALITLFSITLYLAAVIFYASDRNDYHFVRSNQANQAWEQYLNLAINIERHIDHSANELWLPSRQPQEHKN